MTHPSDSATWSEIHAQPAIWRAWAEPLARQAAGIRQWIADHGFDEVVFAGAGSSAFIGDIIAFGRDAGAGPRLRAVPTTDIVSNPFECLRDDPRLLVVQFGRSGDSSESIGTLDLLDAHFPKVGRLHITCNPDGALALRPPASGAAQQVILLPEACHDRGFAMTSSFTTMLLSGLACLDPSAEAGTMLRHLADSADALLQQLPGLVATVPGRAVFLGSAGLKGAARESALKVLELTAGRVPTLWDGTLGFRHGPKSVLTGVDLAVVMVHPDAHCARYDRDVAAEIRSQYPETRVIALGTSRDDLDIRGTGRAAWDSVLHILLAQVLAVEWSAALGFNIDDPFVGQGRLSRVVSGVTLYPAERGAAQ